MKKINYKNIYPVYTKEISKENIIIDNVDDICKFFIDKINSHPFATYIGIFDHYGHTNNIEGNEIHENIKNAKNVNFCFGKKLLDPKVLAVRPRSIGVCEMETHFIISFMEPPNPALIEVMILWVNELLCT